MLGRASLEFTIQARSTLKPVATSSSVNAGTSTKPTEPRATAKGTISLRLVNNTVSGALHLPGSVAGLTVPSSCAFGAFDIHCKSSFLVCVKLVDVLRPSPLGYVSPIPQRRDAFLANHVGRFKRGILRRPRRNQVIVPLANKLLTLIATPPIFC